MRPRRLYSEWKCHQPIRCPHPHLQRKLRATCFLSKNASAVALRNSMSKAAISLAPNSMIGFRPKKRFCALPNSHRRVEAGNTDPSTTNDQATGPPWHAAIGAACPLFSDRFAPSWLGGSTAVAGRDGGLSKLRCYSLWFVRNNTLRPAVQGTLHG